MAAVILVLLLYLSRSQDARVFRVDLRWIGLCVGLTICQLLAEALVWYRLLAMQGIRYPYPKTLLAYLASQYLGLVTPNHVGELLAAGHISVDTGITFGYGLSSVVMKKALAAVTAAAFGIWSVPLLAELRFLQGMQVVVWSVVVLIVFSAALASWVVSLQRLARKWEKVSPWKIEMAEFWAGVSQLVSPRLLAPLGLSVLAFSLLFFQLDAVLHAMGVGLSFALISKLMALSRITARFFPLSVFGFGSKDVLLILLLRHHGIAFSDGLTAALLLLMCSHLVTLLLSGLSWWIKPLVIRRVVPANS
ncbi:MAG: flippase-like domain-containing protein [Candidatus Omnitrophica bacterium]|nr:flippase-like domain-containing protein [Candidatus Omnitrophota bacterium]